MAKGPGGPVQSLSVCTVFVQRPSEGKPNYCDLVPAALYFSQRELCKKLVGSGTFSRADVAASDIIVGRINWLCDKLVLGWRVEGCSDEMVVAVADNTWD